MPRTYDDEIQQRILERKKRAEQAREEQIRKRNQIFMIGGIALVVLIVLIIIISKIASGGSKKKNCQNQKKDTETENQKNAVSQFGRYFFFIHVIVSLQIQGICYYSISKGEGIESFRDSKHMYVCQI